MAAYQIIINEEYSYYDSVSEALEFLKTKDLTNARINANDNKLFFAACEQNLTTVVAACLKNDEQTRDYAQDSRNGINNHSPLYIAAVVNNNPEMTELLLKNKFNFFYNEHQSISYVTDATPNVIKELITNSDQTSENKVQRIKIMALLIQNNMPYPTFNNYEQGLFNQTGLLFDVAVRSEQPILVEAFLMRAYMYQSQKEFAALFTPRFGNDNAQDQNFMYLACKNKWDNVINTVFSHSKTHIWGASQKILVRPATVPDTEWRQAVTNYVMAIGFENLLTDPNLDQIALDLGNKNNSRGIAQDTDGYSQLCIILNAQGKDALRLYIAMCACKEAHSYFPDQHKISSLRASIKPGDPSSAYIMCANLDATNWFQHSYVADMPKELDGFKTEYTETKQKTQKI